MTSLKRTGSGAAYCRSLSLSISTCLAPVRSMSGTDTSSPVDGDELLVSFGGTVCPTPPIGNGPAGHRAGTQLLSTQPDSTLAAKTGESVIAFARDPWTTHRPAHDQGQRVDSQQQLYSATASGLGAARAWPRRTSELTSRWSFSATYKPKLSSRSLPKGRWSRWSSCVAGYARWPPTNSAQRPKRSWQEGRRNARRPQRCRELLRAGLPTGTRPTVALVQGRKSAEGGRAGAYSRFGAGSACRLPQSFAHYTFGVPDL